MTQANRMPPLNVGTQARLSFDVSTETPAQIESNDQFGNPTGLYLKRGSTVRVVQTKSRATSSTQPTLENTMYKIVGICEWQCDQLIRIPQMISAVELSTNKSRYTPPQEIMGKGEPVFLTKVYNTTKGTFGPGTSAQVYSGPFSRTDINRQPLSGTHPRAMCYKLDVVMPASKRFRTELAAAVYVSHNELAF
ncbi:hypothetical protein FISHEDRAFT_75530 [Fistulina hepatica ATCC 64428]|uniref:Uncharacterized protein n=1 Tax=Fistulina hepatica ATCC 64428 TaxID=1128425 RepID=A0A0D7A802_9AGAR|nr:hypothetical protein FISHEDRAFT_75530 [Fistulina hepatica ATCC 64428]